MNAYRDFLKILKDIEAARREYADVLEACESSGCAAEAWEQVDSIVRSLAAMPNDEYEKHMKCETDMRRFV